MKKLFSLLMLPVLAFSVLSLTACASPNSAAPTPPPQQNARQ